MSPIQYNTYDTDIHNHQPMIHRKWRGGANAIGNGGLDHNDVELGSRDPRGAAAGGNGLKEGIRRTSKRNKARSPHPTAQIALGIFGSLMIIMMTSFWFLTSFTHVTHSIGTTDTSTSSSTSSSTSISRRNSNPILISQKQQQQVQRVSTPWKKDEHSGPKYAIFLQIGTNFHLFDEMTQCLRNVAQGLPENKNLDIHIALIDDDKQHQDFVRNHFSKVPNIENLHVILTENAGGG